MKRTLYPAMVFLMALLLGACATAIPVQTQKPAPSTEAAAAPLPEAAETVTVLGEEDAAIARCRAVLDEVQQSSHYKLTTTVWYENIYDTTRQITYYRSGDDRAVVTLNSGSDHDGEYLTWASTSSEISVQGQVYQGYANAGEAVCWEGPISNAARTFDPWLYTFQWDAQPVAFLDRQATEDGYSLSFRVEGTYPNDRVLSEDYTITFYFDEADHFLSRQLTATGYQQSFLLTESGVVPSGEIVDDRLLTRVDWVSIDSLDADSITAEMNTMYQQACAQTAASMP